MSKLVCPKCGDDRAEMFVLLTNLIGQRDVQGFVDGVLMVDSHYESDEADEPCDRFLCMCNHEFPVPEDITIDYV